MVDVIKFPPVSVTAAEWTVSEPISESYGIGGSRYASAYQPIRKVCGVSVPAVANDGTAAGLVEMFKRQMRGGVNLCRLRSYPSHWHLLTLGRTYGQKVLEWTAQDRDLEWNGLQWTAGTELTATVVDDGDWDAIEVTGLPVNQIVAYPSEIVEVGGDQARVLKVAKSDESGTAVIRLDGPLPAGSVLIGATETAVFRMVEMPRAMQPAGGNWSFDMNFVEVFENETDGFNERDPWQ